MQMTHSPRTRQPPAAQRAPAPHPAVLRPSAGGQPLPAPVQAKMEGALGHNFANVRVHRGEEADSIGAVAFTRGSHIHFAPGRYNPHSAAGQRLLGHELAHVVQQRAGRVAMPGGPVPINADHRLEAEADTAGSRAASGLAAGAAGVGAGAAIQRSLAPGGAVIQCGQGQSRPVEPKDDFAEQLRREREAERAKWDGSGIVQDRTTALFRTRFQTAEETPRIGAMFSMKTASPTHDLRTRGVASALMGRMFHNLVGMGNVNLSREKMGDPPMEHPGKFPGENARLQVQYNGVRPSYDYDKNTISLMDPDRLDQAGHELQHAHDHISGNLDLDIASHRLYSEQLAFQQQAEVSREAYGQTPAGWSKATPVEMAQTYHTKSGYPGTLEASQAKVEKWREEHPVPPKRALVKAKQKAEKEGKHDK